MTWVVDASATLYLVASADGLEPVQHLDLVAPALLWSEVTSVLSEMRWRNEISASLADICFERLVSAPIGRRSGSRLYRQARAVAEELGWAKTYDAEYVALARILETGLISRDARLQRGAARLVRIIGPDEVVAG